MRVNRKTDKFKLQIAFADLILNPSGLMSSFFDDINENISDPDTQKFRTLSPISVDTPTNVPRMHSIYILRRQGWLFICTPNAIDHVILSKFLEFHLSTSNYL
jgi:hypothetical protein